MEHTSTSSLLKQQDFPDRFKFYLKQAQNTFAEDMTVLHALVRPRLKIAIVTETWPPEINGVAHSLLHLSKGLQKQGHKILLIRPEQRGQAADFVAQKECLVKAHRIPRYANLQFGVPQILKINLALEEFAPDVVHIVTEGPLGLAALHAAKAKRIPVSSGFHSPFQDFSRFFDLAFLVKPIQSYLKWFHNNTALTCVPSRDTEKALRDFGVTCPLTVVGRGVDVEHFNPQLRSERLRHTWNAQPDTRVLLYVGRLSPEKEIPLIIATYKEMQAGGQAVKLVIVGDGPQRQELFELAKGSDIIFTGNLYGTELATVYASCDVFVFASQVETFGNVVLEAMASGLPVIAYDYAAAHLYVKHHHLGWLAPLGDQAGFCQYIQQLPHLKTLQHMGQQARQVAAQMGWDYPVQQFEHALYRVAREYVYT